MIGDQAVSNFYLGDVVTTPNGNAIIEENMVYQIAYTSDGEQFTITIFYPNEGDHAGDQQTAENSFLTKLGITQDIACSLNVTVQQVDLNLTLVGEFPLSFCNDAPQPTVTISPCRAILVAIDQSNAQGVMSGALDGLDGCRATIGIKNERPYWVNFRVSTVGNGITLSPAGGHGNFFAENHVLPPNGSVLFEVGYTARGQTVTALVDSTTASGWPHDK